MEKYDEIVSRAKAAYGTGAYDDATIEFLVPDVKESEDERIRKDLVAMVKIRANKSDKDKFLVWLEKQKINTDGDFARGYDCGYQCCLNSHGAEWLEKRKEQKPIVMNTPRYSPPEQKPAEWSERDKEYLNQAIETLEHEGYEILATALKSINPQQKVEWSEEDEKMLNKVLDSITYAFYDQGNEGEIEDDPAFLWLHRLRPSWKPSGEQMEALDVALKMFPKDAPYRQRLESLYNDLKKQ